MKPVLIVLLAVVLTWLFYFCKGFLQAAWRDFVESDPRERP